MGPKRREPNASFNAEASFGHPEAMGDAGIARVAALLGEPTRAAMLDALMDGSAQPAGELARRAGVAPSTASGHLARLLAGRLVVCEASGRERRYRLASAEIAEALEALALLAPESEIRSLRAANRNAALRTARTCYDHLAGRLGVSVADALVERRALLRRDTSFELTTVGETLLGGLGVDIDAARSRRRSFARSCLDWSERRPHLAGALGAELADALFSRGWLQRRPSDRALTITHEGAVGLQRELGVDLARA
jgi:DNA-binding transcriptional ArsR family regulator